MIRRAVAVRRLRETALWVGASLGVLCLLLGALALVFDVRPLVFKSGSMSPDIEAGALALARETPAKEIENGDVVSVVDATGTRVTHRVVSVEHTDDAAVLQLKGDANSTPDAETYTVDDAYRVFVDVPYAGYVVNAASTPWGLLFCGGFVTLLLVSAFGGRRTDDHPHSRSGGRGGRHATRVVVGAATAGLLLTGASGVAPFNTMATFSDTSVVSGGPLTALTVPPSASFTCGGLGVLSVRFNWTAVANATNYTLHYGSDGSQTRTVTGTTAVITAALAGGTAWVQANRNFGSVTWTSVPSQKRTYTVAVVSLCS